MREKKLNFRFHDPNSEAQTADYILELFFEVDREKVETAVHQVAAGFEESREEEGEEETESMGISM